MKTIPVKVTYLEMATRPRSAVERPSEAVQICRARRPTVGFYRFLYDSVGRECHWVDRTLMSDEDLGRIIHDQRVEIHVLYVGGVPAGYAELDRRTAGEVELVYFGVMPEFAGKGLGRYFLHWAVDKAWSYEPRRVWVHTCELDHQAALPLYMKAGFEVFDRRIVQQVVP